MADLPGRFFRNGGLRRLVEALPESEVVPALQGRPSIRKTLTAREREIALLVCDGLTNRQLGQQLDLTEGTVKVHLHKIYRKLGLRNRAALSALAVARRASLKPRCGGSLPKFADTL